MLKHLKNLVLHPRRSFESLEEIQFEDWRPTGGKTQLLVIVWLIVINFLLGLLFPHHSNWAEPVGYLTAYMVLFMLILPILWLRDGRLLWDNGPVQLGLLAMIAYLGIVNTIYVQILSIIGLKSYWLILVPTLAYFLFLIVHYVLGVTEYQSKFNGWKGSLFFLLFWILGMGFLMPLEFSWRWVLLNGTGLALGMILLALYMKWRGTSFGGWRFGVASLASGGTFYLLTIFGIAFLVIFSYQIQPIESVKSLTFQPRVEKPNAQENFRKLTRLANRANELKKFSSQQANQPDTVLIERHRETMSRFRDLLEGKEIQVPRDLFWKSSVNDADTEWDEVIRLISVSKLHRMLGEREEVTSAMDRARFLVTAGDTLVQAEGTYMFRLTAYSVQNQGLKLLREILRKERLSKDQLQRIKALVKHHRNKRVPYHDLLAGEAKTLQMYLSIESIMKDFSAYEKVSASVLFSRSFRRYRMITRKYYRTLISLAKEPYWAIKTRKIQGVESYDSPEFRTPIHIMIEYPYGVIWGFLWETSVSMHTPKVVYDSEARAKTRMNCLLKAIHDRLNPDNRLPGKYRLNLTTGEPLPDGCLSEWEKHDGCGCDGEVSE